MTRILHIIPGLTGGGAEHQLSILATAQSDRGLNVHIALLRTDVPPSVVNSAVHVHALKVSGNHDPRMFSQLRGMVRTVKPHIVQTWLTLTDVVGGGVALFSRVPWVLSERSESAAYPPSWKNRARVMLGRQSSAIIANSDGGAAYWSSHGVPDTRITVIPNAVETPSAESSQEAELPAAFRDEPLVLFAGRFSEEKNPLVLIDALSRAFATAPGNALLCGAGPLEQAMRNRIAANAMHHRIVLGGYRSDIPALMRRAQLCVAISQFEGNPNVALQAMAAGCPLVVSDVPGYTRLLDQTCASVVPVNDAERTAAAIASILQNPGTAARRAAIAKQRLVNRTPGHLADAHEAVYARLV